MTLLNGITKESIEGHVVLLGSVPEAIDVPIVAGDQDLEAEIGTEVIEVVIEGDLDLMIEVDVEVEVDLLIAHMWCIEPFITKFQHHTHHQHILL